MKTIRWGIIGVGDVTEVKSGPGFQKADNSAVAAVMRRRGELAKDYAKRHGVEAWYDDGQALVDDPNVDAVYIATPPNAHKEYTLMAAAAGKPVYVEKPMGMNYAECQEMIRACESANVPLWVAYYRRALPRFLKVKELIENGHIGDVRFVSVKLYQKVRMEHYNRAKLPWRVQPDISGGGIFVDLASHIFDYLDFFLGLIIHAEGHAGNQANLYPAEDVVAGHFVFESGIHGTGIWSFAAYANLDKTEIVGTKGKITFASFGTEPIRVSRESGENEYAIDTPQHVQQPLIQSIVNELNGQGQCPSTGMSASRANWVMDQMLNSYYG